MACRRRNWRWSCYCWSASRCAVTVALQFKRSPFSSAPLRQPRHRELSRQPLLKRLRHMPAPSSPAPVELDMEEIARAAWEDTSQLAEVTRSAPVTSSPDATPERAASSAIAVHTRAEQRQRIRLAGDRATPLGGRAQGLQVAQPQRLRSAQFSAPCFARVRSAADDRPPGGLPVPSRTIARSDAAADGRVGAGADRGGASPRAFHPVVRFRRVSTGQRRAVTRKTCRPEAPPHTNGNGANGSQWRECDEWLTWRSPYEREAWRRAAS